ncbi:MAG: energy-coupled thiamine transporter ThiT [Synergistaceae bacterium]|nr:energy-coupled thiamine transporter ThiT [Synergistaceae bacterium]
MKIPLKVLVEGALSAALAVALSYFKLFSMPQGGSVSLTLLPLLIFSFRNGARYGIFAGAVTGLLRLMLGGYVVHPLQALLDYPAASALIGLAGFFPHRKWLGVLCACSANFAAAVLSGVIFFSSYAPEGTNVWLYSAVYNGSSVVPETVILTALVYLIMPKLKKAE